MAKMTIAQLRELALESFNEMYIHDYATARSIVRYFYLLCAHDERLLYLENDERTYSQASTESLRKLRDKRHDKISEMLKPYGLRLTYYGYLPTLETENQVEALSRFFY